MISFFVSCESILSKYLLFQIITLCRVMVILFATEAILYPVFIHIHIFMMSLRSNRSLCSYTSFAFLDVMPSADSL